MKKTEGSDFLNIYSSIDLESCDIYPLDYKGKVNVELNKHL